MDINQAIKEAAEVFITEQSGTSQKSLNNSVIEALKLYVTDKGGTPATSSINDLVNQATAYYFTEQSVSPAPRGNDAIFKATELYLTAKSEYVPKSFNERLLASAGYLIENGSVASSAITSFEIVGATPLDATGDYSDATSRPGVVTNGWVAKVTVPYLAGQTFDPTKVSLTVQDPGYTASGTTTVTRTITGTALLRRQYNAATSDQITNDGLTFTAYFALSDDIFVGATSVTGTVSAGFYGSSTPGAIASITNSSTRAYEKPTFFFYNLPQERATGSGFYVEGMAFSRWGRNQLMVPRVEYIGKDHLGNAATTQTVTDTALATLQTEGYIGECYPATIPLSGLTQAAADTDISTVNVKVYPWIGDSTAVLDLEVDGYAWPTIHPLTPLRFLNDKNETYGGAIAFVKVGAASGAVYAVGQEATARGNPFPTANAAANALAAWNNTNRGHNSHSGAIIYLMDDGAGGAVDHAVGASITATPGGCWTEFKADPNNTAAVSLSPGAAARAMTSLFRIRTALKSTNSQYFDGGLANGNTMLAVDGVTYTHSGTSPGAPMMYRYGLGYARNVRVVGTQSSTSMLVGGFSTTRTQQQMIGYVQTESPAVNGYISPWLTVGCDLFRSFRTDLDPVALPNLDLHDGAILYNTGSWGTQTLTVFGNSQEYSTKGFAVIQVVVERAGTASTACLGLGSDGTVSPFKNGVEAYVTYPDIAAGIGRSNRCYADVAGAVSILKEMTSHFCLWGSYNCKADTFTTNTVLTGRVGGWRNRYTVGHRGNVSVFGSASGTAVSATGTTWLGEYWQTGCQPYANGGDGVTWVNNMVSTTVATGRGDYKVNGSSNEAYNRVPAGSAMLKRDLMGVARFNDGTGAAGAIER